MKIQNLKNIIIPIIVSKNNEKDSSKNKIKKNYTSYSKLSEVKLITIGLASPERIKQWSEKMLPNGKILGEVMNANTLHHKTFKPQKGGLFCERIFGPLKDFECACGKPMKLLTKKDEKLIKHQQDINSNLNTISNDKNINFETNPLYQKSKKLINLNKSILGATDHVGTDSKSMQLEGQIDLASTKSNNRLKKFCNICEVEYTWSVMRRYQLGYIKLISPVTHVWYLKGNPSYLSILLDIKKRHLEYITYCSETLTLENVLKGSTLISKSSDIVSSWKKLKLKIKSEQENIINKKSLLETKLFKENLKSKVMSYSKISGLLIKTNKTLIEQIKSPNSLSNILENKSHPLNDDDDYSSNNNFLTKFLSISNKNNKKNNGLSKLLYSVANIQKLKKRNNLNLKKFDFNKKWLNSNQEINFSNSSNSRKKSLEKKIYPKILNINKVLNGLKTFNSSVISPLSSQASSLGIYNIDSDTSMEAKRASGSDRVGTHNSSRWSPSTNEPVSDSFNDAMFSKCIRKYSQKLFIPLKNLKYLIAIIKFSKHSFKISNEKYKNFRVENNLLDSNYKKFKILPIKKILKKISVSAYILVNLYLCSQKTITKNLSQLSWEKVSSEAYIKALVRSNQILNRVNCGCYGNNLFSSMLENEDPATSPVQAVSTNLEFLFKKIKKRVYNLLNFYQEKISNSICMVGSHSLAEGKTSPKKYNPEAFTWATRLELYTLSSFPVSFSNLLIANFLLNEIYTISNILTDKKKIYNLQISTLPSELDAAASSLPTIQVADTMELQTDHFRSKNKTQKNFNIIIKDLTSIFIKVILKNRNFKLNICFKSRKSNFYFNQSSSVLKNLSYFSSKYVKSDFLKINEFNEIKNNLLNYYLMKSQTNIDIKFFNNYLKLNKISEAKMKLYKNKLEDVNQLSTQGIVSKSFQSVTSKTKKLFNNIYCLSHRERWEVESDWNFLYYYVTVQNFNTSSRYASKSSLLSTSIRNTGLSENSYFGLNETSFDRPLNQTSIIPSGSAIMPIWSAAAEARFASMQQPEQEKIIYNYKNRFENIYKTDFSNSLKLDNTGSDSYNSISRIENNKNSLVLNSSTLFSGPGIVELLLSEFNFFEIKKMDKQNRILLYQLNKQILKLKKRIYNRTSKKELKEAYKKRDLLIRRTKLVRKLFIKESSPQNMILTVLPVLPPDLRPIVKMGGQIAASDLNRLYQRVIYRNDRLKKFLKDPATSNSYEMKYAQRLLQEAVDNLIQNGKSGVIVEKDSRGRALKSLSDILKGKQGRFRQYLLGKRVDYSGRSVIVVGPRLKLHECGIPKEMALELYLPFLLKRILNDKLSRTVVGAKMLIKTNPALVWELLREIMQTCPVLLNRAPTLHRLGIQAFQPTLIDGRAILLHPLVCAAFNADFDGDQMAVHVPITVEARAEAWKLMLSRNSILSTATGDPLAIPSQDMVLGCYYLTTNLLNSNNKKLGSSSESQWLLPNTQVPGQTLESDLSISLGGVNNKNFGYGFYFSTIEKVLKALELKKVNLHSNIWLKWSLAAVIDNGADQEEPIEIRLESSGNWKEIYNKTQKRYNYKNICLSHFFFTTPGKIIFNLAIQKALN